MKKFAHIIVSESARNARIIIALTFFLVPLVFFAFPSLLTAFSYGFEINKVYVLYASVAVLIVLFVLNQLFSWKLPSLGKYWFAWLVGIGAAIAATMMSNYDAFVLWGNSEKGHGMFFYGALLLFAYFCLFFANKHFVSLIGKILILVFILMCVYGIFQATGIDARFLQYQATWNVDRVFSTLGNPNYLAGYILLMCPIIRTLPNLYARGGLFILAGVVLFLSKSLLGGVLFVAYLLCVCARHFWLRGHKHHVGIGILVFLVLLIGLFIFFLSDFYDTKKLYSLATRFHTWKMGILAVFDSSKTVIWGYGPDTFSFVSQGFMNEQAQKFIGLNVQVDRSHNVFLDSWIHLGLLPFLLILFGFSKMIFANKNTCSSHMFLLFAVFFFFNIPVVSHYLLLVYAILLSSRSS